MCVEQQAAPGEQAAGREHAHPRAHPLLTHREVHRHLLRVDLTAVIGNAGQQRPDRQTDVSVRDDIMCGSELWRVDVRQELCGFTQMRSDEQKIINQPHKTPANTHTHTHTKT